jgi:hypothetical protein
MRKTPKIICYVALGVLLAVLVAISLVPLLPR